MNHYKSWAGLKKQLEDFLCDEYKGRISYFLTRYHKVHDSYGRAAICMDGKELVCFSWIEMYRQEADLHEMWSKNGEWDYENKELKEKWDTDCTYYEMDFLDATLTFLNLSIKEALESDNYIIKILAIMDRRLGKRTLKKIVDEKKYQEYPEWVRQFFELRLKGENNETTTTYGHKELR